MTFSRIPKEFNDDDSEDSNISKDIMENVQTLLGWS